MAAVQRRSPRWASQFESVTGTKIANEIWRDLAIGHLLYRQSEQFILGRRGDRIAALRLVTVFGREPDIDMLPRLVFLPTGYV
jgi:hypothetical protein